MAQVAAPQRDGDVGHAHRRAGVARVGLLHGVHRERADRVGHQGRRSLRALASARAPWRCAGGMSGETIAAIARGPFGGEPSILEAGAARPAPIIAPMRGLHLTADLRGCAAARPVMTDARRCCDRPASRPSRAAGLTPVGELFHRFAPARRSGAGAPAGSPASSCSPNRTSPSTPGPSIGAATLDVYVCNLGGDNSARAEALLAALIAAFAPASVERHALERGSAPVAPAARRA